MSESYIFGFGRGKVSGKMRRRIDAIAKRHEATFISAALPDGHAHWFFTRNLGHPFDLAVRNAVFADLEADKLRVGGKLVLEVES
jgi:hypothetical protein